ncbi:hypothetical protein BKG71_22895 [Mycobacteroides chelonae]|nr:hypothetical protein BKG71_22895 [Mycobacteroides chelonae]
MDDGHVYEWHRHDPAQYISSSQGSLDDALWAALVPNEQERTDRRARGWSITPGPATALHSLLEPITEALADSRTTAVEDCAFDDVSKTSGAIQRQHRVPQPHARGA